MTASVQEKAAYGVAELLDLLPLGRSSVYEGIRAGEIPSVRIGRRVLIPAWWIKRQLNGDGPT